MIYDEHKVSLRNQLYNYLSSLTARIRFTNGGLSNVEVMVTPDTQGNGVFLYMIDNGRQDLGESRTEKYVRLTPKNARRIAHALLFLASESEVKEDEEVLTPKRT